MVGTKLEGLTSIADFYATVAGIAGVDPTDHKAAAANLPPIDSVRSPTRALTSFCSCLPSLQGWYYMVGTCR